MWKVSETELALGFDRRFTTRFAPVCLDNVFFARGALDWDQPPRTALTSPRPARWAASNPKEVRSSAQVRQNPNWGLGNTCDGASISPLRLLHHDPIRVVDRSYLNFEAHSGDLRLLVIFSGPKLNPMTVSALLGPGCDLATEASRVGMMSRLRLSRQPASTCLVSLILVSGSA